MTKQCSICGKSFPQSHFDYGGKVSNSYCRDCNREDRRIRSSNGGSGESARAAVARWRSEMQARWKRVG